jgi:hypothetical protein
MVIELRVSFGNDAKFSKTGLRIHKSLLFNTNKHVAKNRCTFMALVLTVNDFDKLLVQVTEETIKYCLGDVNATIIWNYLEERNCPMPEIPNRPEIFSEELRNMMGFGRRQILGAAEILEETILEILCKKLGINFECEKPTNFPYQVRKLRDICKSGDIRR